MPRPAAAAAARVAAAAAVAAAAPGIAAAPGAHRKAHDAAACAQTLNPKP